MKADVLSIAGKKKGDMALPDVFKTEFRPDLIRRAVLSMQSKSYQPQGRDPMAGKKKSTFLSKRRRAYKGVYGAGRSRTPKKVLMRRGRQFRYEGAFAPNTKGGRIAHAPQVDKVIVKRINSKERILAIKSAVAATINKDLAKTDAKLPIIFENKIESMEKTKDVQKLLDTIGISKSGVGPLFVVSDKCNLTRSARNLGDVVLVKDLNAELLAPGTRPGRLCIWSEDSIKKVGEVFGG